MLGEPVSRPAWAGVAGGFCGVLLVIRPDPAALDIGAIFILFTGFTVAVQMLLNRKLGSESDPLLVSMWGAVVASVALSVSLPSSGRCRPATRSCSSPLSAGCRRSATR